MALFPITPFRPLSPDLDLSPLRNALAGFQKGTEQAYEGETARQMGSLYAAGKPDEAAKYAFTRGDPELGMRTAQFAAQQAEALEKQKERAAQSFAKMGDIILAEKDPATQRAMFERWKSSHPKFSEAHKSAGFPEELADDPVVWARYWGAIASKYRDPLEKKKIEAEIAKAGVTNLSPGERAVDLSTGKVIASAPEKSAPLIKEGDKPLVVFEPGPDGRLQARTVHEGSQGNAVTGIAGGMRELHDIPTRYGGDKGVFGSAVGAFQGDPNSYILGPLARAWGSLSSYGASGPGSAAPPAEVRRAIEGATNTLAASLKPLIRKPGEGSWSDRDQAVLDSIVGNLTRANDVAQYDRELENVRLRIKQNFNIDLPQLIRKPNTDRLPQSQSGAQPKPNPEVKEGTIARNPRTGDRIIMRNGQWHPL